MWTRFAKVYQYYKRLPLFQDFWRTICLIYVDRRGNIKIRQYRQ